MVEALQEVGKKIKMFIVKLKDICYNIPCVKTGVPLVSYERLGRKEGKNMDLIRAIEAEQLRKDLPSFNVGDTVKVHVKVREGNRERIQVFEGLVLKRQNGGVRETFTVRRISYGVGVERTFPVHSPIIDKIEVIRRGKVRRAKLYYIRKKIGKAATRVKEIIE